MAGRPCASTGAPDATASDPARSHRAHPREQSPHPRGLPRRHRGDARHGPDAASAQLREPGARLRRVRGRQAAAARRRHAQPGDRHGIQRHAVGAPALRGLSGADPRGRAHAWRHRAGRRRRTSDVRRRHPGSRGNGPVAVLARCDRAVHRDRAQPRHVRRRDLPGRLRQDRARPADRRPGLRPPAGGVRARGPDDARAVKQGKGRGSRALRRGRGHAGGAARGRGRVLPLARHLHLLRHRQLQPGAARGDGPATAGDVLRQPGHAAARRAHRCGHHARTGNHRAGR